MKVPRSVPGLSSMILGPLAAALSLPACGVASSSASSFDAGTTSEASAPFDADVTPEPAPGVAGDASDTASACTGACDAAVPGQDAAPLPNALLLFGGSSAAEPHPATFADTWTWNGKSWTQLGVVGPGARYGAGIFAAGGAIVLVGGAWDWDGVSTTPSTILGDTWTWDGSGWTPYSGAGPDGSRYPAAGAAGVQGLVFGGNWNFGGGAYVAGTWSWVAGAWAAKSATGPAPRASAATGSFNGQVVLFGGTAGDPGAVVDTSDTWIWDGSSWTQRAPAHAPPARHAAALTRAGGKLVLFGGQSRTTGVLGDSWTWDGTDWTPLSGAAPPGRAYASAATLDGEAVLFGGSASPGSALDDTWTFDGTSWTEQAVTGPSARTGAAMAGP